MTVPRGALQNGQKKDGGNSSILFVIASGLYYKIRKLNLCVRYVGYAGYIGYAGYAGHLIVMETLVMLAMLDSVC